MKYQKLYNESIVDGPGIRVALYVSGCPLRCPGCHNRSSWDFNSGEEYTEEVENNMISFLAKPYIKGLSLLGGEPLAKENIKTVAGIVERVKKQFPEKSIWVYTGYEWEDLPKRDDFDLVNVLLNSTDVLVVGPFKRAERDISTNNLWRGSRNQRVIDVQRSLKENKKVFLEGIPNNESTLF